MISPGLLALLAIVAVAAYIQTVTGFALGLVLMGGIGLTGILPLQDAAVLSSLLVLVQGLQVLRTGWRHVAWRPFALIFVACAPGILAGYGLLLVLVGSSMHWLQLILGLIILVSSIQLVFKPQPLPAMSSPMTFSLFGGIAGIMSGLFATSGPPLVYLLYRQPIPHRVLRDTLVFIFFINAIVRLATVVAAGDLPPQSSWWALAAIPMVIVFTFVARRWPPPLSDTTLRRIAFGLLLLSGLALAVPAVAALVA